MKLSRLVPALAVLVMAGEAAALDEVAPVTSLATDDALLLPVTPTAPNPPGSVPDVDAVVGADPLPALDLSDLGSRTYAYSTTHGWRPLTFATTPHYGPLSSGLAIVETDDGGGLGTWEYKTGDGSWTTVPSVSDDAAFLLALAEEVSIWNGETFDFINVANGLRFRPYADANDGTASLTFRIWDGSDDSSSLDQVSTANDAPFAPQAYGGSPTAFSAETRTLTVHVRAVNDPPQLDGESSLPTLVAFIPKTVGDLLATANRFSDPDGNTPLGIAISSSDTVGTGWQFKHPLDATWQILGKPTGTDVFVLAPNALLRYTGGSSGTSLLSVRAWDQAGGQVSGSTFASDNSISALSVSVNVDANSAPSIDSVSADWIDDNEGSYTLYVQRGQPTEFTIEFSDGDSGDVLAWSTAAIAYGALLELDSESGSVTYRYTPGILSDTIRFEVSDLASNTDTKDIHVVLENSLPEINAVDGETYTVRLGGPDLTLDFSSYDLNGDTLLWSATQSGYALGSLSPITLNTGPDAGNSLTYTPMNVGTETVTVTVNDGYGDDVTVVITINVQPENNAPTVALAGAAAVTVHVGDEVDLSIFLISDDIDGDSLDWSYTSTTHGSVSLAYGGNTGATTGNIAYYHPQSVGSEILTITVDDGFGGSSSVEVTITVLPETNVPPTIDSISSGDFAIVGQPFEAVVKADDGNLDDVPLLSLAAVEYGGLPVSITRLGDGLWRVTWTPTSAGPGTLNLSVTDPSLAADYDSVSLTYVAAPTPVTLPASLPTSSAGNIVYGAIAPGSASAFAVLDSFLNGQPRSVARAFWWTGGGYAELPGQAVSDPLRAGVFLASTVPANLSFAPPTQPAPFAITLRAGQWTFFGIPPLMLDSEGGSETTHPWSQIQLQTLAGDAVDLPTKLAAIGPETGGVSDSDTQPWQYRWDLSPAIYQRTSSISSGTGYWLRNRSGVDYRLVRQPFVSEEEVVVPESFLAGGRVASASTARPVSAADVPPAPPASQSAASSAAADGGGGSCGSGGLAGLLIAGLALLGLRPRRRA